MTSAQATGTAATTLGQLRRSFDAHKATRSVKEEIRDNLLCALEQKKVLFTGIHGYEETVLPQIVNAILAKHNFILLGLRGQAKSRILRGLTDLLDAEIPYIAGCEIHDHPFRPLCKACRELVAQAGDDTPIAWLSREQRYVEKLATPDVTIADIIGDVDPIKAARTGNSFSRRTEHSLRIIAARKSRNFCGERASRSCRKNSGGALQHHAGRRHPD